MNTTTKIDKDEKGKCVDIKTYQGMIGSLLYLTTSRPDIIFSICLCARFQFCPKESHLHDVKRILRCFLGTIDVALWYCRNVEFNLVGYSDADFAGSLLDRKSTSGTCQFLGSSLVSWFSKKKISKRVFFCECLELQHFVTVESNPLKGSGLLLNPKKE